jgi:alkylation response protein AidB-like acyl-CoA dehydrogenase
LIYVPEPWPGVTHGKFEVKCGMQADRNTSTFFDDVHVPKEWGLAGPVAWSIFETSVSAPMPLKYRAHRRWGYCRARFDVLLEYTTQRVAGGRPVAQHLSAAMILGEFASLITVGRAAYLELAHEYDNMDIYGMWNTTSMVAKGHAVHAYITRAAPAMILKGMELMGSYGYVRRTITRSTTGRGDRQDRHGRQPYRVLYDVQAVSTTWISPRSGRASSRTRRKYRVKAGAGVLFISRPFFPPRFVFGKGGMRSTVRLF